MPSRTHRTFGSVAICSLVLIALCYGMIHGTAQAPASLAPSRVLVVYNANWGDGDGDGVGDSLQVANYYASKRGVPAANLLGLGITLHFGPIRYDATEYGRFYSEMIQPIRNKLDSLGPANIDVILLCYGVPYNLGSDTSGTGFVAIDNVLMALNNWNSTSNNVQQLNNPYVATNPTFELDRPRFTHQSYKISGQDMYLVARLDGMSALRAENLVDQALYAERYLAAGSGLFNGNIYVDNLYGPYTDVQLTASSEVASGSYGSYLSADANIAYAEHYVSGTGLSLKWENTANSLSIGQPGARYNDGTSALAAPRALMYGGWYNAAQYFDVFEWLPGAVGCDLNSGSMISMREGFGWGAAALARGATAVCGVLGEPFLTGHPRPNVLLYYLLKGYTFAEASTLASRRVGWMAINIGDPLYTPFKPKAVVADTSLPAIAPGYPRVKMAADTAARIIEVRLDDAVEPETARILVDYGLTTAYGATADPGQGFYRSAAIVVSGLQSGAIYHYRVRMTDPVGNTSTSGDFTFSTGGAPPPPPAAVFAGSDSSTRGNWIGVYGAAGYSVASDATNLPAATTITPAGQLNYTWTASTSDTRALQRPMAPGRVAATWYQAPSFDIAVGVAGGQSTRVSIYCVDFDSGLRSQRLDVLDAGSGALVDSQTVTGFSGGVYLTWVVTGSVRIRATRLNGNNAIISGVFIDGGGSNPNQPPSVSLTSPASGAAFAPGSTISLQATASDTDGSVSGVAFFANGQLLGSTSNAPFAYTWTAAAGTYALTAVATDNAGLATTSTAVPIAVAAPSVNATATFAGIDHSTQGNWFGAYGSSGYSIVADATSLPSASTITLSGGLSYTWAPATNDVRALQRASGSGRVAAAWYQGTAFDIVVGTSDGQPRRVALYCADFDSGVRAQRFDVYNGEGSTLLDSRTLTEFSGGAFVSWTVTGPVRIRVTRLQGNNAVVGGVFLDGAAASAATAVFAGSDTVTRGNWLGGYGAGGYSIVGDSASLPPSMTVTPTGQLDYIWSSSTGDSRALQRVSGSGRLAATWYQAPTFNITVASGDASARNVALYCLDFDSTVRSQQIDVYDSATNVLLDSRVLSGFSGGVYLRWTVTGSVRFQVTSLSGNNAVVSAVFIN
ncbi:MAG TPA: TIGR03790 family protein [Vicinamibacterales bacterium]|nr:TIGR03790 family protein [Vicinamibacterales bacterium]